MLHDHRYAFEIIQEIHVGDIRQMLEKGGTANNDRYIVLISTKIMFESLLLKSLQILIKC